MPVNTPNAEYGRFVSKWQRCRDTFAGQDAIKAAATTYLPRLTGLAPGAVGDQVYSAYLNRALFYNGVARTVVGLTGAVFIKPLRTEEVPNVADPVLDDVTLTDVTLEGFARDLVGQAISPGRAGALVDMPNEAVAGARPFWVTYRAEQIINWRTVVQAGDTVLTLVVLEEKYDAPKADDLFVVEQRTRYRVLQLTDQSVYTQTVWEYSKRAQEFMPGEVFTPTRRGMALDFIPFVFMGPEGLDPGISDPPLMSLVDVNLSLYLTSADLEWGRHWTALPTPVITGTSVTDKISIGSSEAIVLSDPQAKAFFLEFSGAGLGSLERAVAEKREMMATLGARLLENLTSQETATAVRLRHAGEHASLATIASSVSMALSKLLQWTVWWMGTEAHVSDDIQVLLNTDFAPTQMTADEVQKLMLVWQAGGMSYEQFFANLQRGGMFSAGTTIEDERQRLVVEGAALPGADEKDDEAA